MKIFSLPNGNGADDSRSASSSLAFLKNHDETHPAKEHEKFVQQFFAQLVIKFTDQDEQVKRHQVSHESLANAARTIHHRDHLSTHLLSLLYHPRFQRRF
jgi:hypothetical protein